MSYAQPVYTGADGEVSATIRRAEVPPELVYDNGVHVRYLSTGASTHGLFGLYRWDFGPQQTGPGPHFHRGITESFFILAGTVQVHDGTDWVDTHAGDYVHVPEGGIHGFRNVVAEPASMLLHFSPGAPREGYFEGLARGLSTLDPDEVAEFMQRHDNHWV